MMEDQLNKYVEFLQEQGYNVSVKNEKIKIFETIEGIEIVLWCILGDFFPYEIPQISIEEESKKKLPRMPHFYIGNKICVFDKSKAIPNFNDPFSLIADTVSEAILQLKKGILGENKIDFIDEFLEYWSAKSICNAQMFVEDLSVAKEIYFCVKKEKIIISDSELRLIEITHTITGSTVDTEEINTGLFIPLNKACIKDIPQNDVQIVDLVEKNSAFSKLYKTFMQNKLNKPSLIVFNQPNVDDNMIAGWMHFGPGIPNGFRKGHVNLKIAFMKASERGCAVSIDNCHQNRLFTRGGDGSSCIWKKVCVIGCGSIGSFLTEALKLSGVDNFILVDNERLEYENIARHSCGYNGVSFPKALNVAFNLEKWNPNISATFYTDDAHKFVEENTERINDCDILFVAVASTAVEHHINKLILEKKITVPVVFIWVEPYSLGGHAILLKKTQDLYEEIFDTNTFEYKYGIAKDAIKCLKRESGCQSTYMPYSGFRMQEFIYRTVDCLMTECWTKKGNFRITWCGRLSEAENLNIVINEEYEDVADYSIIVKRVD